MRPWVKNQLSAWVILSILSLSVACFAFATVVHAQFLDENMGLRLTTNPTNPRPNTNVEVSLDDYSVNAVGATLTWYVDGVEQTLFKNERTISVPSKNLGDGTGVRVVLSRRDAPPLSSALTIAPTVVDILIESDTYVPYFYKGRALPSEESELRMIAVVHDGTKTPDTSYTYTWSENGTVLFGGPVKGKNVITLPLSRYGSRNITVDVIDTRGELVGRNEVILRAQQPEIHFYEESPLRGLSERELTSPFSLTSDEVTIYGEPYFMNAGLQDREVDLTWSINNEQTTSNSEIPNAITLRRVGGEGSAMVGVRALTTKRIPQLIEKTFQILF